MTQSPVADGFEVFSKEATDSDPTFMAPSEIPDPLWVERITNIPVGASFRVSRIEPETNRQFIKRINRAAMASPNFKKLEWKSMEPSKERDQVLRWSVRVLNVDVKAQKAHAERMAASQNGQDASNSSQEAPQTTPEQETPPAPENEPSGPRATKRG